MFWALLGLFVALPWAMGRTRAVEAAIPQKQPKHRRGASPQVRTQPLPWAGLALAGIAIFALGLLSWTKSVNYLWASAVATSAFEAGRRADPDLGLALINQAISRVPEIEDYHLFRGILFTNFSELNEAPAVKIQFAEKAIEANLNALEANPFSPHATAAFADSTLALALLGRDEKLSEAFFYYDRLPEMLPNDWEVYDVRANAYLKISQPGLALIELEKSLKITADGRRSAKAHALKGIAYYNLGEFTEAKAEVGQALEIGGLIAANHAAVLKLQIEVQEALANESRAIPSEGAVEEQQP